MVIHKPKRWNSDFRTFSYKRMVSNTLRNGFYITLSYRVKEEKKLMEIEDAEWK